MGLITKSQLAGITNHRNSNIGLSKGLGAVAMLKESVDTTKNYDIFLSHSYLDREEIASLKMFIEDFGLSVYVDWIEDADLNRGNVTKRTAQVIKHRMKNCKSLIYAFSENSPNSKWMPWELGYFDGFKERVAVLPITNNGYNDNFLGTEYLSLYPYVTHNQIANTNNETLWIRDNPQKYITIERWLIGKNPIQR
jgi:hypothetical protein